MTGTLIKAATAKRVVRQFRRAEAVERDLRQNRLTWADVAVLWLVYLVAIGIPPVRSAWIFTQYNLQAVQQSRAAAFLGLDGGQREAAQKMEIGKGEQAMKDGEAIAGFPVTSARGRRLLEGNWEHHEGVDLATPVGTPIYAPAEVLVKAWSDSGGGGNVVEFQLGGFTHKFLHLSEGKSGRFNAGEIIGYTGNTGRSTGPHLDYRMQQGDRWVEPSRQVLTSVMSGKPLGAGIDGSFVERYKAAISRQESGNNYGAVNGSGSGATGKYQFMPATAKGTAARCGIPWSGMAEFKANPEKQEQVMSCYVQGHLEQIQHRAADDFTRCRMLASIHYSGSAELYSSTRPQYYNGNRYPSIADYTRSVCKEFK